MNDETSRPALPATGGRPCAIIPADLDAVYRLSQAIYKSGLAPKEMDAPEKIMVAILHGAEIGLPPMASIQKIAIINGRAVMWGDAAIGLCLASPLCEDVDEYFEGDGDSRTAVCIAKRKGREKPIVRRFSVSDAKAAGLWSPDARVKRFGKDGKPYEKDNDSPWHRFPDRMVQLRARGFALRDAFPDVLGGLYLREEMDDERGFDNARDVQQRLEPPTPPPVAVGPIVTGMSVDPAAPPTRLESDLFDSIVWGYADAAKAAKDVNELDTAWFTHIAPVENKLPKEFYEKCAAIDDAERGRLETA